MKKLFFILALLISGCSTTSFVLETQYSFPDDMNIHTFSIQRENTSLGTDYHLFIDGVRVLTGKLDAGKFDSTVSGTWNGKNVVLKIERQNYLPTGKQLNRFTNFITAFVADRRVGLWSD
jgi:hypothetical protein